MHACRCLLKTRVTSETSALIARERSRTRSSRKFRLVEFDASLTVKSPYLLPLNKQVRYLMKEGVESKQAGVGVKVVRLSKRQETLVLETAANRSTYVEHQLK